MNGSKQLLREALLNPNINTLKRFEEPGDEGVVNFFLGMAAYRIEKVKMASILSACTEIFVSWNSFYWDLKLTLAEIDCRN